MTFVIILVLFIDALRALWNFDTMAMKVSWSMYTSAVESNWYKLRGIQRPVKF